MLMLSRTQWICCVWGYLIATFVVISIALVIWSFSSPSLSIRTSSETLFGSFQRAAVVTSAAPCASIAKDVLKKGGNAVDAAIAAMLCDGLGLAYANGIGGGFLMLIYNKTTNTFRTIDARETAPAAATVDMFHGNANTSRKGGLSVAVPGTMKGLWTAYQTFGGGVSWEELLAPSVKLCEEGIPINENMAKKLLLKRNLVKNDPEFKQLFTDSQTGKILRAGQTYKNLKLARTLRKMMAQGGNALYEGELATALAQDIQEADGIITAQDLQNYTVFVEEPLVFPIDNGRFTLYSLKPPASGAVLAYILRTLSNILPAPDELATTQRMTEAFKYAYAARGDLGDHHFVNVSPILDRILSDEFIRRVQRRIHDYRTWNDTAHYQMNAVAPDNSGTANLAVFSEIGDAVVATCTLNTEFGSEFISKSTGIILNNEMDDFSSSGMTNSFGVAPSEVNFIEPGKRPMSSMCPSIITDHTGKVTLLIGGAGGTQITTSVAISAARNIFLNENIREAMDQVFFHHQLLPMVWMYSSNAPKHVIEGMRNIGHGVANNIAFAVVNAIQIAGSNLYGSCDRNRPGHVDGY